MKSLPTLESKYRVIEKLYLVILCTIVIVKFFFVKSLQSQNIGLLRNYLVILCTIVVVKFFLVKNLLTSESKYRVIEKLYLVILCIVVVKFFLVKSSNFRVKM